MIKNLFYFNFHAIVKKGINEKKFQFHFRFFFLSDDDNVIVGSVECSVLWWFNEYINEMRDDT